MPNWLIFQLLAMAAMPAAYDMARDRDRSTKAWLSAALIFGPLALLALLILGKRKSEVARTVP
jgi:formate hydrogenlyase subunit 3/multisubunit Na+/H+ antiporter MnhD subunit